jgi:hypothetical protein
MENDKDQILQNILEELNDDDNVETFNRSIIGIL